MATILKCKMCGGDIEVNKDMTVGTCLFCGSIMTLPRIDTDKKARLFNRANDYRLNCEFDKAYDAYKTIVEEDEQEAEAYWGMILSEYGVEYVEDPTSKKRIPTCHRTHIQPIRTSTNYKMAVQYADPESKFLYQDEAEELDKLQKDIIARSAKETPYDVFICYKETDDSTGERTKDSVIAEELFNALSDKGIRAFFSRISLEEHIGENYEPYIYAALQSAHVMLLVTTSNEHCNAVWVKNEWMRFLQFMQDDKSKVLIPAYSDMTAYELPDELISVQGQDLNKIGAIQDTVRGILKLLDKAPTNSNDKAIKELIADKTQRDEKREKTKNLISFIVLTVALAWTARKYLLKPNFNNGYTVFSLKEMWRNYRTELCIFSGLLGLSAAVVWVQALLYVSCALLALAVAYEKISFFNSKGAETLLIAILVIHAILSFYFMNTRGIRLVPIFMLIVADAILLVIPARKLVLANSETFTSYNQMVIIPDYANIREAPTTESAYLGQVFRGMIFDIMDVSEGQGYQWYRISTANGIEGYVRSDLANKAVKISVTDEYVNVREDSRTDSNKIGELHKGDVYYGVYYLGWIKITYEGKTGYVSEKVVNVQK